ncbi:MAG: hypothetical protein MUO26_00220 [Methanotrichaceae archaeon]|nr:hypothetical protein [Methanotrichaceae archaeon]
MPSGSNREKETESHYGRSQSVNIKRDGIKGAQRSDGGRFGGIRTHPIWQNCESENRRGSLVFEELEKLSHCFNTHDS